MLKTLNSTRFSQQILCKSCRQINIQNFNSRHSLFTFGKITNKNRGYYKKELIGSDNSYSVSNDQSSPPTMRVAGIKDWFESVMNKEKPKVLPGMEVRFSQWNINIHNDALFTVNFHRYREVYLILGGERVYWLFYSKLPYIILQGSCIIDVAYCTCCLHSHFIKIIHDIKKPL